MDMDLGIPASSSHSFIRFSPQAIPCGCNYHHDIKNKELGQRYNEQKDYLTGLQMNKTYDLSLINNNPISSNGVMRPQELQHARTTKIFHWYQVLVLNSS